MTCSAANRKFGRTRRGASTLRGEAFEDGLERDPAGTVFRTTTLDRSSPR